VCSPRGATRIDGIRNILGVDVERYGAAAVQMLREQDASQAGLFGCFAARKMLESACVALLSHLDPARLLILREYQLKGDYDLKGRQPASIDWRSDVVAEKKLNWGESVGPDKFIRALLGGHLAEVAWIHAIDQLPTLPSVVSAESKWIQEIVGQFEQRSAELTEAAARQNGKREDSTAPAPTPITPSHGMLSAFRMNAQGIFSTLSKGVHLEFVIEPSAIFDHATILESVQSGFKLVTQLAFIFHLMDCTNANIDLSRAAALVLEIEHQVEI